MNTKPKFDLTGKKFGRLTALKYVGGGKWLCKCDCGNITTRAGIWMRKGQSKSCGCLRQENLIQQKLIDLTGQKFGKLTVIKYMENCKWLCKCDCGNESIVLGTNLRNKRTVTCFRCSDNGTIMSYDTFKKRISFCEKIRRNPDNKYQLQVKCTNCNEWFNPNTSQVYNRIRALNSLNKGEMRFYCSDKCKQNCPIYKKQKWPEGEAKNESNNRPGQKEWAETIKERDNYECQICGSSDDLNVHHYEGINCNPIESWDLDNGITLCKSCHKNAHKDNGCRYADMRKIN